MGDEILTSDHSASDGGTEEGLSGLLHLDQDHGRDFLRGEVLLLALECDTDVGLVTLLLDNLEWPVLHVILAHGIREPAEIKSEYMKSHKCASETRMTSFRLDSCRRGPKTYLRPMRRLASNTVFSGLRATWFLAASPIKRSWSVKAT
jgi:hypothetical protein